ncbi:DRTGG domain-containing protein [Facklamia hominis]|uniref:DRTGG domain-containing protein n=1 Tax=Facklamia hominis TaxID=178214 RepID=UPI0003538EA3|nr:DRTGG domain-containing protein [Facklamia hominis]EPH12861.1 hypothetical protein HMPREF9260_00449 [Facklamia hominis ACS-120-V-Sch10]
MTNKQENVLRYIQSLPLGSKISVRSLAKKFGLSQGTVYRAIQTARDLGYVSTIERVGTIRISKKLDSRVDDLNFSSILSLIDGHVLGGKSGMNKPLSKFIIGAMTLDAMAKYFAKETLLIVGNRADVQRYALKNGLAVLVTGGFTCQKDIIDLADRLELPLLTTVHDTFTVASLINRTLNEQMLKEEIIRVEEIYTPFERTLCLKPTDTVKEFNQKSMVSGLSRFPVVVNQRLVGVVTANDLMGLGQTGSIERAMSKELITTDLHSSLAAISYKMVWEDIEMIPVVADDRTLLGVVSRYDVMKALQVHQKQPQSIQTFEDKISDHIERIPKEDFAMSYDYRIKIEAPMVNQLGTLSYGYLSELIVQVATDKLKEKIGQMVMLESLSLHYFTSIQLGHRPYFKVNILNLNRRSALVDVKIYLENVVVAQANVGMQIIEKTYREV